MTLRRLTVIAAALGAAFLAVAAPAAAGIEGPCTATFNGQDVATIDTPGTALEVSVDDSIAVFGTDSTGTATAEVGVEIAGFTAYFVDADVADDTFSSSVAVSDYAVWGVGIYEVVGRTDDCQGSAFVKVTGRAFFATVIGGTATVLALGGLAMVLGSWIPAFRSGGGGFGLSIFGGLLGGLGLALLLQQAGITPLSATMVLVGAIGGPLLGGGVTWLGKFLAARAASPA